MKKEADRLSSSFNFIQVPENVLSCRDLDSTTKLIYGMILSLSRNKGYAYANNKYFADKLGRKEGTISNSINQLRKLGYIEIDNRQSHMRQLRIRPDMIINSKVPSENVEGTSENNHNYFSENSQHNREGNKEINKKEKKNEGKEGAKIEDFRLHSFSLSEGKIKELKRQFSKENIENLRDSIIPVFQIMEMHIPEYSIYNTFGEIIKTIKAMDPKEVVTSLKTKGIAGLVEDHFRSASDDPQNFVLWDEHEDRKYTHSDLFDNYVEELRRIILDTLQSV